MLKISASALTSCRKALQLLREVLRHRPADVRDAVRSGAIPAIIDAIASDDAGVREAALALLALMVQHPGVVQALRTVRHCFSLCIFLCCGRWLL